MIITAVFTDYGKRVKCELINKGMKQSELIEKIKEKTGLFCDDGYIYKILTGKNASPKIVNAINEILCISADSE